ncbi:MAG: TIGR01459 family HAD-type hydrolase [Parvibaculum sp.]|nr:TIGR01459 family HAD-type hydrolase [Parvibaculum sp.]
MATIPLISGLAAIADKYDALLCDVWGVLHNGKEAYAGVADALANFRAKGGTVLLLSNAPRPSMQLPMMLANMGITDAAYNGILTSGDATKTFITQHSMGTQCFAIGPGRDNNLFDDTGIAQVSAEEAEFITVTGPFDDDNEGPEDYRERFEHYVTRKLPMVCANPDIVVERGPRHIYCAGALARLYEELGGKVVYFGKPHGPIYDVARARLTKLAGHAIADKRILAVGDGIATDIKGAVGAGIDALFITGGIAAAECGPDAETPDEALVTQFCKKAGLAPVAATARLVW